MEDLIVGIDKHSAQLVLFDDSHRQKEVSIPLQVLEDHPSVVLRTDLMDTHIHICSPELMLQFSDNFDYQDIRRDFISNEVINWELGMHIYGYLLNTPPPGAKAEYAARVQDPRTYHAISRDIVTRWVEPFVPDGQLLSGSFSQLMRGKHSVYGEEGVQLPATARVGNGVVLGAGTVVGKNVVLNRSIIGRGCAIGAGSTITESHLWAGVLVGTDCTIEHAIIAPGVIIKRGAKIGRGCILAANVVVGEDVHLPNYTRLSMDPRAASELASGNNGSDDDDDGWGVAATTSMQTSPSKKAEYDYNTVGTDGRGYVWQPPSRMQDDEDPASEAEEDAVQIDLLRAESMGCSEEECARRQRWRRVPPPIEGGSDDDAQSDEDAEGAELAAFTRMVADMIVTGHKEGHGADNLLVEIKGLKFAQNKTFADCLRGMMPELLAIPVREDPQARPMAVASRLKQLLSVGGWAHLMIKPFTQGADDEVAIIEEVENAAISSAGVAGESPHRRIFRPILQILYDAELVTEDALLQWAAQRQAEVDEEEEEQGKVTSARLQLFQDPTVQEFVAWLEEDESEEDDDEDEEED